MSNCLTKNPVSVAIIADDLTGAMDTGLQFAQQHLEAVVMMDPAVATPAQVAVYSTETRELPASQSARRLTELLPHLGKRLIYKKIDSTLRGNVGYELRALSALSDVRAIVVAPAFPPGGRTTVGGQQFVHGRPLAMSEIRHDPRWPMRESHVPTLLMQQAGMEVGLVDERIVAQGHAAIVRALLEQPSRIIVVDASTMDDLAQIAKALHTLGSAWIPSGSAGLAQPWAAYLSIGVPVAKMSAFAPLGGASLFVCGSRNPDTLRQVERLAATDVAHITLDVNGSYDEARELARLTSMVCGALGQGQDTLLEACTVPLLPGGGPRITRILGGVVQAAAESCLLGGLFMTGGDVAISICRRLGVEALRIVAEIQPGLPAAQLLGGPADGLAAATKAGGFGTEDALLDVRRWFDDIRQGARAPLADL